MNSQRRTSRTRAARAAVIAVCLAVAAALIWDALSHFSSAAPRTAAAAAATNKSAVLGYAGAGSCASSACHGGDKSLPAKWQSSYSVWATSDRHSQSYSVLFGDLARQIELNLAQHASGKPEADGPAAHKDARCLGCHSLPEQAAVPGLAIDGVSCEACHGPAGTWLVRHTLAGFGTLPAAEKYSATGMHDTKDLVARAESCVACHVGGPPRDGDGFTRDVNHDLIAAGHPRLNFEFSAFLANMPPHWATPTDEAQAWAVGQIIAGRAALELLTARADKAAHDSSAPWPEFSEYACFDCHHPIDSGLHSSPLAQAGKGNHRRPGSFRWGSWYTPMPDLLAGLKGAPESAGWEKLQATMLEPLPDAAQAAAAARETAAGLQRLLPFALSLQGNDARAKRLLSGLTQDANAADWDHAAQSYLALVALHNADVEARGGQPTPRDAEIRSGLVKLRRTLQFPAVDPKAGRPDARYNSPHDFRPAQVEAALEQLRLTIESNPAGP
jgi:hypothetical protein